MADVVTKQEYNALLAKVHALAAQVEHRKSFTEPIGMNKILQRRFKEAEMILHRLDVIHDYVELKAPKKEGKVDVDADAMTRAAFEALGELSRHVDILYSSIVAGSRADSEQQAQVADAYYDLMAVHVKAPHEDFTSNKKRLIDVQDKQYRSALADVKEKQEKSCNRTQQGNFQQGGGSSGKRQRTEGTRYEGRQQQGQYRGGQGNRPPPPQQQQQRY